MLSVSAVTCCNATLDSARSDHVLYVTMYVTPAHRHALPPIPALNTHARAGLGGIITTTFITTTISRVRQVVFA